MKKLIQKCGFSTYNLVQLIFITVNAQLLYAFWDLRNSLPMGFPAAMGVSDSQAGELYAMQGLVIIVGTIVLGWIGDRFKVRNIMLLTTIGVGLISLFIAVCSPGLSMGVLIACFFIMLLFSEVLFKPANFKAVSLSTTKEHQGVAFGMFEFGRGLLAFLLSLLWAAMVYFGASSSAMMITSSIIVLATAVLIFFAVPNDVRVGGGDEENAATVKEAFRGIKIVSKLPIVWVTGLNVFCIYGTFVAAGTYFARFLEASYGASATIAAIFAAVVIALRMLPIVSTVLVTSIFKSTSHFMRFMSFVLVVILAIIGILFYLNPASVTELMPNQVPADIVNPTVHYTIMILMLCASAFCFMIRGVYYAPIGEAGIDKKNSSSAMSLAITIGYIPALLAPLVLGHIILSPEINNKGEIMKVILTPTSIIGSVFIGLAVLTLIAAIFSWMLVRINAKSLPASK